MLSEEMEMRHVVRRNGQALCSNSCHFVSLDVGSMGRIGTWKAPFAPAYECVGILSWLNTHFWYLSWILRLLIVFPFIDNCSNVGCIAQAH